jgi:hypothetical protein
MGSVCVGSITGGKKRRVVLVFGDCCLVSIEEKFGGGFTASSSLSIIALLCAQLKEERHTLVMHIVRLH